MSRSVLPGTHTMLRSVSACIHIRRHFGVRPELVFIFWQRQSDSVLKESLLLFFSFLVKVAWRRRLTTKFIAALVDEELRAAATMDALVALD
jgi:hypothetical protein